MPRLVRSLWLLAIVALVMPVGAALAAESTLPGGGKVEWVVGKQLFIKEGKNDTTFGSPSNDQAAARAFNLAHCQCGDKNDFNEAKFQFTNKVTARVTETVEGQFWVGEECLDVEKRKEQCEFLNATLPDLDDAATEEQNTEVLVGKFIRIKSQTCPLDREGELTLSLLARVKVADGFDYQATYKYRVDTNPPPPPSNVTVSAVEDTITVSWSTDVPRITDVDSYQAFCAEKTDSGYQPIAGRTALAAKFQTGSSLCGSADVPMLESAAVDAENGSPVGTPPPEFLKMSSTYLCGETSKGSSIQIKGLKTDHEYLLGVVAIDFAGNPKGVFLSETVVPIAAIDFWEDLHDRGSKADGGFCLINETYGGDGGIADALRSFRDETLASTAFGRWLTAAYYDHVAPLGAYVAGSTVMRIIAAVVLAPAVALALAWHLLSLPGLIAAVAVLIGWRRRRSRRSPTPARAPRLAAAGATLVAVLLVAGAAQAQSMSPYWEEPLPDAAGPARPSWHVGLRLGPYTPAIDAQFRKQGGQGSPYAEMFGGSMWLPVLDVDWLLFDRYGQLGVGGSIGYTGDGNDPYQADSTPGPKRPRAGDADTSIRLMPLAATVVYRATQLDDRYGIPVVPYARAGLSYYLWWITSPTGDIAKVGDQRAVGASAGLQGSIGIAVRAENVDKDSARSMRESGIEHAGFYAELALAWVDGFGADSKLAVGDATWFAGFDFEF